MGGAGPGEAVASGGVDRPFHKPMLIGRDVMNFDWGDHRKVRWRRLCSELLGGEEYVDSMTALLNLDSRHSTAEEVIPSEHLESGLQQYVWPLLQELPPRIVCPLTNRVWTTVAPLIAPLQIPFAACPIPLSCPPIIFRLPATTFTTILIKPHNHPSCPFMSNDQMADLGKACRWFLGDSA